MKSSGLLHDQGVMMELLCLRSLVATEPIYLPFQQPLPSWQLAVGISALLEKAGFKIMAGWLEVFPNQKPFSSDGSISLYNGHRLPMQQGSYLLNAALQPIAGNEETFTRHWQAAARRNDICEETLTRTIKQYRRRQYRITGKADKFLNDLNTEIELGWTDHGQTNRLLGRIAMRSYIFGHVLQAPAPLTGNDLIADIVNVATRIPGYTDYCGHQHEITERAKDWARSVEKSHYFPYGSGKSNAKTTEISHNEQQRLAARDRIRDTVIELLRSDNWPEGVTARIDAIRNIRSISGTTLYKNKDLWHPVHLEAATRNKQNTTNPAKDQNIKPSHTAVEIPPNPPVPTQGAEENALDDASLPLYPTNLLGAVECNPLNSGEYSPRRTVNHQAPEGGVRNTVQGAAQTIAPWEELEDKAAAIAASEEEQSGPSQQLVLDIQATLERARIAEAMRKAQQAEQYRQQRRQQAQAVHRAQLEAWVNSGDPVLEAEARHQLQHLGLM